MESFALMNRNALLFIGLGIAVLAGLFLFLRPTPMQMSAPATAAQTPAPVTAAAPAVPVEVSGPAASQVFEIVVHKGQRVSGPAEIQVHEGQNVTLKLTSDQPDELHLHGYDLHLSLRANVPAALAFQAVHSGRFDYELHHAHVELGTLEVLPR